MLRSLIHNRKVLVLVVLAVAIRLFAFSPTLVERLYSRGVYPPFSRVLRLLLGWLPLSFGDLFYASAAGLLIWKGVRWVRRWRAGQNRRILLAHLFIGIFGLTLLVYVVFQLFWGLNYSRQGIAYQLALKERQYKKADLTRIAAQLQQRLAETAPLVDTIARERLHHTAYLEQQALAAYKQVEKQYPFLGFRQPSFKPSLYSAFGHFFGFTGYYNPFSGEAQIKTSIPVFLKPFIATHEMAHQLGYGKESEANFVAFLTCRRSADAEVRYSGYFEMFLYTLSALRRQDSTLAKAYRITAPQRVQRDMELLAFYLEQSRNPVEPYVSWIYDAYLRRNNQPKGKLSYNEVVVWLVAYDKKYGWGRT